jgi:hypothetical protein
MQIGNTFLLAGLLSLLAACGDDASAPAPTGLPARTVWFTEITDTAAIDFNHSAGQRNDYYAPDIIGSGGALFDFDGDGDLDVYLIDAATDGASPNRMLRQEAGGRFTDVTEASGLGDRGYGMGAALGDVDNDGDLDLFLGNFGADALYLNLGGGRFEDATAASGLGHPAWSTSACFLDYDRDGNLDLYVATYLNFDPLKACTDRAGNPEFCGPTAYRGLPDLLYRGRGDGTFTEVGATAFASRPANKGLGVICADFDGDALTDVYVTNDGEENQLWIRRGGDDPPGSGPAFEDRALVLGAALNLMSQPEASMGVAAGDVDGDLDLDLFMTHLDRETNTLYRNLGELGFEDFTAASGLGPAGLSHTGFGTTFFDADQDGDLDLVAVNGRVRRGASLIGRSERQRVWRVEPSVPPALRDYAEPNLFFLGDGRGGFEDAGDRAGRLASAVEVSRGVVTGDVDDDGDLDLLLTNCGGAARLYRNDAPAAGHWLKVRAVDPELGREVLGAQVRVLAGGRAQMRPILSSTSYLMATEPEAHFGLGDAERFESLTIVWPDGVREEFPGGAADRLVRAVRGRGGGA